MAIFKVEILVGGGEDTYGMSAFKEFYSTDPNLAITEFERVSKEIVKNGYQKLKEHYIWCGQPEYAEDIPEQLRKDIEKIDAKVKKLRENGISEETSDQGFYFIRIRKIILNLPIDNVEYT